jgi:hypothetical protein
LDQIGSEPSPVTRVPNPDASRVDLHNSIAVNQHPAIKTAAPARIINKSGASTSLYASRTQNY